MRYKANEIDFEYWPCWMKVIAFATIPMFVLIGSLCEIPFI